MQSETAFSHTDDSQRISNRLSPLEQPERRQVDPHDGEIAFTMAQRKETPRQQRVPTRDVMVGRVLPRGRAPKEASRASPILPVNRATVPEEPTAMDTDDQSLSGTTMELDDGNEKVSLSGQATRDMDIMAGERILPEPAETFANRHASFEACVRELQVKQERGAENVLNMQTTLAEVYPEHLQDQGELEILLEQFYELATLLEEQTDIYNHFLEEE